MSLKHPVVGAKLGLLDKDSPKAPVMSEETVTPESVSFDSPTKWCKVSPENLSPDELIVVSGDELVNKLFVFRRYFLSFSYCHC